jgi:glycosyltransferase involved in cell wall biosynthesis
MERHLQADGHQVDVFPGQGVKGWLLQNWGNWSDFDVVHFHIVSWTDRVLMGMLSLFGIPVVLTVHGDSLENQVSKGGWLQRKLLGLAVRRIPALIGVKKKIQDQLESMGVSSDQITVVNAYLPPVIDKQQTYTPEIENFIAGHSPLITANGFEVVPLSDEIDLYGINLLLDLCAELKEDFPHLGCLFFLAQIGDEGRYQKLAGRIEALGVEDNFRFILGQKFTSILEHADVFIRPTYQDGFGISVSEAIYFGVPAVVSDVCEREPGAVLFQFGDQQDLVQKTRQVLTELESYQSGAESLKPTSAYDQILNVYLSMAGEE